MKIPHTHHKIQGWFSFYHLYTEMVEKYDNAIFLEIGTWKGKSAAYMATEIANSGKNIKFYCVDTWEGSAEHLDPKNCYYEPLLKTKDGLYAHFLKNIEHLKNYIIPIRKSSIEATENFKNNSLDFIYIDASHDYENVKKDLNAWFPKLKKGGTLAGHDYPTYSGVRKAVDEFVKEKNLKFSIYKQDRESWIIEPC